MGFGNVRYVCVVFGVLVMRCLYADKVPVSMRQPSRHSVRSEARMLCMC